MSKTALQQKTAKVVDVRAITIMCEECEEPCVDEYDSTMITEDSKTVTCRFCRTEYVVPRQAFHVVYKAKLKEVKEHETSGNRPSVTD